VILPARPG